MQLTNLLGLCVIALAGSAAAMPHLTGPYHGERIAVRVPTNSTNAHNATTTGTRAKLPLTTGMAKAKNGTNSLVSHSKHSKHIKSSKHYKYNKDTKHNKSSSEAKNGKGTVNNKGTKNTNASQDMKSSKNSKDTEHSKASPSTTGSKEYKYNNSPEDNTVTIDDLGVKHVPNHVKHIDHCNELCSLESQTCTIAMPDDDKHW
jgi:hypothetical protein